MEKTLNTENKPFRKVVIRYEVLCQDEESANEILNATLSDIGEACNSGHFSGMFLNPEVHEISEEEMKAACLNQGTDPSFFLEELD